MKLRVPARLRNPWLLAMLPLVFAVIGRAGVIAEADVFWGARAGDDLLHGSGIVHADAWTWSAAGDTWTPNSWLWNVVLSIMWRAFGYAGFALLLTLAAAGIFAMLIAQARRRASSPSAIGLACFAGLFGATTWLSPRAHLATYLALIGITSLVATYLDERSRTRSMQLLAGIAAIQILAINMHLGALSIVPIVTAGCIAWLFSRGLSTPAVTRAALPVLVVALASFVTPIGVRVISHSLDVQRASSGVIKEWRPGWNFASSMIIVIAGFVLCRFAWKRKRPFTAGGIACAAMMTIGARRFEAMALLLLVPELAAFLTTLQHRPAVSRLRPLLVTASVVFCLAFVGPVIGTITHPGQPSVKEFSVAAVKALPEHCRALNSDLDGGLIALIRRDVQTSTDGRNDLFGKQAVLENAAVLRGQGTGGAWLAEHGVTCVIVGRKQKNLPFLRQINDDTAWHATFGDRNRIVFERVP